LFYISVGIRVLYCWKITNIQLKSLKGNKKDFIWLTILKVEHNNVPPVDTSLSAFECLT